MSARRRTSSTTIRELCHAHKVAALYVTHDLAVVANLADQVAVMYAGRIVEQGRRRRVVRQPAHPYTRHLIAAAPDMSTDHEMVGLAGRAPCAGRRPVGLLVRQALRAGRRRVPRPSSPPSREVAPGRLVRCIRPFEVPERTQHVCRPFVGDRARPRRTR